LRPLGEGVEHGRSGGLRRHGVISDNAFGCTDLLITVLLVATASLVVDVKFG
jgi:hypothetical protein